MADLSLIFPEFSESKVAEIKQDVVVVKEDAPKPTYDLLIVIKSLASMGTILNFASQTITIDQVTLEMRDIAAEFDVRNIRAQFWELLEPGSCCEATNGATRIL